LCTLPLAYGVRKKAWPIEAFCDNRWKEDCVATSRVTDELTSLQEARARLEAELAGDEHWRALWQPAGQGEDTQASAARQARNTRLKMALADNPLYQAWKHVGEAIDALRAGGADAQRSGELASTMPGAAEAQAYAPTPLLADKPTKPPTKSKQAQRAADVGGGAGFEPRPRAVAEPEEATVTFVRREPLLPSAQLPADLGTSRHSELFERLRGLEEGEEPAAGEATFASPYDTAEEAEVTIVSGESARLQREAEARAGTIRRLRKALSGD
jgi:hypothetical protein